MLDGFAGGVPGAHGLDVVAHLGDVGHAVEDVEEAAAIGRVQEEGVYVVLFYVGGEGDTLQLAGGALPPLEDGSLADLYFGSAAVVNVDLLAVVDGDVLSVGELYGAEEGLAAQGRNYVDGAGGCS